MNLPTARVISFILNPLFILLILPFFLVYKSTYNIYSGFWWTGYTLIFLAALGLFMLYAVRKGIFTDLDVSRREQRPLIFSFSLILATIYIGGLFLFQSPIILKVISIGIMIGVILISFVNTQIKASVHTATFSGLLMGLALGYGGYFIILFLLIPILGQSRISLKRHTLSEIIAGWVLGSLVSLGIYGYLVMFVYS